jgi:multicomponent Na+:H+ antiporter subunit F
MMETVYLVLAVFLLLNILVGMVRIVIGPTPPDRMMVAQLFATMGVGILLALAELTARPDLVDVALVFVLLGAIALIAFVSRVWRRLPREPQ